ncbi:MAG: Zn-ribbon domain-containing OB-fold protein [Proteobacteria bacterium]|nr:Zn-ribbon domain-containing OB-fold protein [Pseudomonadota bacterium]
MSLHEGKNLPRPTPETQAYWDAAKEHRLLIQQCGDCSTHQFYPRPHCTHCGSGNMNWVEADGRATIVSFSVINRPVSKVYADPNSSILALVRLQEGPLMMTNIIDCDPADLAIGDAVTVVFEDWTDEISMPKFKRL